METANAVGDRKLSDEELGTLTRRLLEIARRISEGVLDRREVLRVLQLLIEGRASQMIEPCRRRHRQEPRSFEMLPPAERRKSKAPLRLRTKQYLNRLYFHYRLYFSGKRMGGQKRLRPEDVMALMWEAENIPQPGINYEWTPVQSILDDWDASEHDRAIVASTLQWLGTNTGREFLGRFVATADLHI